MKKKEDRYLVISLIVIFAMTVSGFASTKSMVTNTEGVDKPTLPPFVEVRINGSPRLPAGTEVNVTIGGDCDSVTPVTVKVGPHGGATARIDMNGCTPTNKSIPIANALVGSNRATATYYCGKGTAVGPGGTVAAVTIRPC